jgi:hypothetical protein
MSAFAGMTQNVPPYVPLKLDIAGMIQEMPAYVPLKLDTAVMILQSRISSLIT